MEPVANEPVRQRRNRNTHKVRGKRRIVKFPTGRDIKIKEPYINARIMIALRPSVPLKNNSHNRGRISPPIAQFKFVKRDLCHQRYTLSLLKSSKKIKNYNKKLQFNIQFELPKQVGDVFSRS